MKLRLVLNGLAAVSVIFGWCILIPRTGYSAPKKVIIFENHEQQVGKMAVKSVINAAPEIKRLYIEFENNKDTSEIVADLTTRLEGDRYIANGVREYLPGAVSKVLNVPSHEFYSQALSVSRMSFSELVVSKSLEELARLIQIFVHSKNYVEYAYRIKTLAGLHSLVNLLQSAQGMDISVRGLEDPVLFKLIQETHQTWVEQRDKEMLREIIEASEDSIFLIGAAHLPGIVRGLGSSLNDYVILYAYENGVIDREGFMEVMKFYSQFLKKTHILVQEVLPIEGDVDLFVRDAIRVRGF